MSRQDRKPNPFDYLSIFALGVVFVVTWALYDRLPDPMPSHFGFSGIADGFMARPFAAWLLPIATLALGLLFRLGQWLLPRPWRPSFRAAPVASFVFVLVATLSGLQLFILRAALEPVPRLADGIWVFFGLMFAGMGLLMPRTRRNRFFGLRTKWSLASDENWERAQRAGARAFAICGAAMGLLGILGFPVLAFTSVLLVGAWALAWSWAMARRHP